MLLSIRRPRFAALVVTACFTGCFSDPYYIDEDRNDGTVVVDVPADVASQPSIDTNVSGPEQGGDAETGSGSTTEASDALADETDDSGPTSPRGTSTESDGETDAGAGDWSQNPNSTNWSGNTGSDGSSWPSRADGGAPWGGSDAPSEPAVIAEADGLVIGGRCWPICTGLGDDTFDGWSVEQGRTCALSNNVDAEGPCTYDPSQAGLMVGGTCYGPCSPETYDIGNDGFSQTGFGQCVMPNSEPAQGAEPCPHP